MIVNASDILNVKLLVTMHKNESGTTIRDIVDTLALNVTGN
ncbi:hypothetical protein WNY59_15540 [Ahrensia kielensis]|uniref:Uncharacterized protein n=1 Tax=Ahrensia kielensis TaxID=76980 RepID=A0ABU9TAT9_9HYPH